MKIVTTLLAATLALGLATAPAAAAPCKDAKGKFIKCPQPPAKKGPCKDAKGKFIKCK